jgi:hypothetical protein
VGNEVHFTLCGKRGIINIIIIYKKRLLTFTSGPIVPLGLQGQNNI